MSQEEQPKKEQADQTKVNEEKKQDEADHDQQQEEEAKQQIEHRQEEEEEEDEEEEEEEVIPVQVQLPPKSEPHENTESKLDEKQQEELSSSQSTATNKMMRSLTGCLINEIQSSRIDYSLLRELNNKSALEYIDMTQRAKMLLQSMQIMNQQENELMSQLTKIDDLVEEVDKLDSVVRKLDEYTKNLHAQFNKLYSSK